jgi:hypothetical protein
MDRNEARQHVLRLFEEYVDEGEHGTIADLDLSTVDGPALMKDFGEYLMTAAELDNAVDEGMVEYATRNDFIEPEKVKTVYRMEVVVWQVDIEENGDETNTECMIEETIYQVEAPNEGNMVNVAEQIRDAFDKDDLLSSYLYDAFNTVLDEVMAQFA